MAVLQSEGFAWRSLHPSLGQMKNTENVRLVRKLVFDVQ